MLLIASGGCTAFALAPGCGLGRPPSTLTDAGTPGTSARGEAADGAIPTSAAPMMTADELRSAAEQTVRGGHAGRVHDDQSPFVAALDLGDGGCGRVAFVSDQRVVASIEDRSGPRGDVADAGARTVTFLPSAGPVCAARGEMVSFRAATVDGGASAVRWTTVTR